MQTVIEGTRDEVKNHLRSVRADARLTLIVRKESSATSRPTTPEARAQALDKIAEMNREVPALPAEAFNRENLYE